MNALAALPRDERDVRLAQLRAQRRELRVRRDALAGDGWESDVLSARKKTRTLSAEDVQAVLAGDTLPAEPIADDSARLLAATDAAIRSLARLAAAEDVQQLQAEADALTSQLQVAVKDALRAASKLPVQAATLERLLSDINHVRLCRDALLSDDIGDAQLPGLRRDVQAEDIGTLVLSALQYLGEAAKAARDQ